MSDNSLLDEVFAVQEKEEKVFCFDMFLGDLRSLVRFVSFWKKPAKSEQAKSNHLQAGSSKSMSTAVSWSR